MPTYGSWTDLIRKWTAGASTLRPQRVSWQYRVESDILVWREKKRDKKTGDTIYVDHAAGYPAGKEPPRLFYYDVTLWRVRLSERNELEEMGGVPVMPFELVSPLMDADRPDLVSEDRGEGDFAALEHAKDWIKDHGHLSEGLNWRRYRLGTFDREFHLGMRVRNRLASDFIDTQGCRDWLLAKFTDSAVQLLGQTGRNKDIGWIRDAIYTALSRQLGAGNLTSETKIERLGQAGCGARAIKGGSMEIFPTPPYLTDHLYETSSVNG